MLLRNAARRNRSRRGFTLMELLVVMAILLVLAGTSILTYRVIFSESKISVAKTQCVTLKLELDKFSMAPSNGGNYPDDPSAGFQVLVDRGFLTRLPIDPWGRPYYWSLMPLGTDGSSMQPIVWSSGPNQIDENGSGDDITSE